MISERSLRELNLSEEQLKKYKELEKREKLLRDSLKKCKVHSSAIERIISKSDLSKVDPENIEALEEYIKETWSDFIISKGE